MQIHLTMVCTSENISIIIFSHTLLLNLGFVIS